jgi:ribosomal protein L15E
MLEYHDLAEHMRLSADALENAQRAMQHLKVLNSEWAEWTDEEKRESVCNALDRLQRVYAAQVFA